MNCHRNNQTNMKLPVVAHNHLEYRFGRMWIVLFTQRESGKEIPYLRVNQGKGKIAYQSTMRWWGAFTEGGM